MKRHDCPCDNLLMVERTCQIEVRYCNQMLKLMDQNSVFTRQLNIKSSVHGIHEPGVNSKHGDEQQGHTKKTKGELKSLNDLNWR